MIHFRAALVLCTALLVTACLPVTSTSQVGSTAGYKNDPQLTGMWKGKPKDADNGSYFVFLPKDDDTIAALLFSPDEKDGGWMALSLQTSELGGAHFMSAHVTAEDDKNADDPVAKTNIPVMYKFSGGKLTLWLIDEDAAKAAVNAGKIKGVVGSGSMGDVAITASPAELDKFVQSADGRTLFKQEFVTLTKVK